MMAAVSQSCHVQQDSSNTICDIPSCPPRVGRISTALRAVPSSRRPFRPAVRTRTSQNNYRSTDIVQFVVHSFHLTCGWSSFRPPTESSSSSLADRQARTRHNARRTERCVDDLQLNAGRLTTCDAADLRRQQRYVPTTDAVCRSRRKQRADADAGCMSSSPAAWQQQQQQQQQPGGAAR
jgi:hypothetical protein